MKTSTYTGGHFDFQNPEESEFNLLDIAHSLSMQCRFNGHLRRFYSVAEHSVLVSMLMSGGPRAKMLGLLHDAPESFISDIPKPVKVEIPNIEDIEGAILTEVIRRLELHIDADEEMWDELKKWDRVMVIYEAVMLMHPIRKQKAVWGPWLERYTTEFDLVKSWLRGEHQEMIPSGFGIGPLNPEEAKELFISHYNHLRWQL